MSSSPLQPKLPTPPPLEPFKMTSNNSLDSSLPIDPDAATTAVAKRKYTSCALMPLSGPARTPDRHQASPESATPEWFRAEEAARRRGASDSPDLGQLLGDDGMEEYGEDEDGEGADSPLFDPERQQPLTYDALVAEYGLHELARALVDTPAADTEAHHHSLEQQDLLPREDPLPQEDSPLAFVAAQRLIFIGAGTGTGVSRDPTLLSRAEIFRLTLRGKLEVERAAFWGEEAPSPTPQGGLRRGGALGLGLGLGLGRGLAQRNGLRDDDKDDDKDDDEEDADDDDDKRTAPLLPAIIVTPPRGEPNATASTSQQQQQRQAAHLNEEAQGKDGLAPIESAKYAAKQSGKVKGNGKGEGSGRETE